MNPLIGIYSKLNSKIIYLYSACILYVGTHYACFFLFKNCLKRNDVNIYRKLLFFKGLGSKLFSS